MLNFLWHLKMKISLIVFASLVIFFTSCSTNDAADGAAQSKQNGTDISSIFATQPPATSLVDLLAPNKSNLAADTDGLHIQEYRGFHCQAFNGSGSGAETDNVNIVLTSDRLSYDQGEIQQMSQYYSNDVKAQHFSKPSSTLRWVEGTSASPQAGKPGAGACSTVFQITNTGSIAIQIPRIALRIKKKPIPNTFTYRLVDQCPLFYLGTGPMGCNGGHGGAPGYCGFYGVNLLLGEAQSNDEIGDKPSAGNDANGNPCPELTLAPQQSTTISVSVSGLAFIYSVLPIFTVITSQGQKILALSAFTSILAFSNRFTCYKLQGNRFISEAVQSTETSNCI